MRGMRKWKRWAVFLLLFVVLAVGGSRTAQAEMLDMTKYNDDLITVSKVPHGKAGNKISIKMTVHNNGSKGDNLGKINRHSPYLSITLHKCYPYYLFGISTFPNSAYHSTALRKFSITIV